MSDLQNKVLQACIDKKVKCQLFLCNGIRLEGILGAHDKYTVILTAPERPPQLVYKHGLSTIVPSDSSVLNGIVGGGA